MAERLQKIMAGWGIASRRHAETLIKSGRVLVNGQVAVLGQRADPHQDEIRLDGRLLAPAQRPDNYYYLLHKPQGVVSTCDDPQGRKTVLAFLPPPLRQGAGIHPVGRLDFNSTGALILTNDGALTYQLTHPRHHLAKTYHVVVTGKPRPATLDRWRQGVVLSGRQTLPAQVSLLTTQADGHTELEIVLWEGRNRQIRRVAEALGHPVKRLHRVAIGPIALGPLAAGQLRPLTPTELAHLRLALGESGAGRSQKNVTESKN
ncbi:MAG TPA: pseudouridine synthase [Candidatus Obscuribacterales bacterium]